MTRSQTESESAISNQQRPDAGDIRVQAVTRDDSGMKPVLFLGFLAACAPTALVFALRGGANSIWYGPAAHGVLNACTSVLLAMVSYWLAREAKLGSYPAVAVLSGGFLGQAIIF